MERCRADGADRSRRFRRITAGPHEVEDALGAWSRPIADADLEHRDAAIHFVVRGLVQVDCRSPGCPAGGLLDHLAAELVVHPVQNRHCEAVPQGIGGLRADRHCLLGNDERHRFEPGDVYAIALLEPFGDLGVRGVQQSSRVGQPVRSGEGHHLVDRIPTGDGHGGDSRPEFRGTRQRPGCRYRVGRICPVDRRLARGLHPDTDPIVVGGLDGRANLDLVETHGFGRHVEGHHVAVLQSNRHRAVRVIDRVDGAFNGVLRFCLSRLRRRHRRRRHQHAHAHHIQKKLFRHGNSLPWSA